MANIGIVPAQIPTYEIRLRGLVSDAALGCFDDMGSELDGDHTGRPWRSRLTVIASIARWSTAF
jgi:hypothetical protein